MAETEGTRQRQAEELRAADVHQVHGVVFAGILNSNQETGNGEDTGPVKYSVLAD